MSTYDAMLATTNMQSSHENISELLLVNADEAMSGEDPSTTTTEILNNEPRQNNNRSNQNILSKLIETEVKGIETDGLDSNETKKSSFETQSAYNFTSNTKG